MTAQWPFSRRAPVTLQRVRIVAPRSAASRALSTTSRASFTQPSEYSKALRKHRLQRLAGRIAAHVERARRGQQLAAADMVVEEQAEPDQPGRTQALGVGQHEAHRPDDVRRIAPQHLALHQRFTHQPELVIFQIAQSAVDQLGGKRRGAAGKVVHLGEKNRIAPPDSVAGNAAAVDAAADDEDVMDRGCVQSFPPARFRTAAFLALSKAFRDYFEKITNVKRK